MRLYIIGDNHDDKGKQLEELTAALLRERNGRVQVTGISGAN